MAQKIDEAYIELTIKDKKLRKGLKDAEKQVDSLGKGFKRMQTAAVAAFATIGVSRAFRAMTSAAMAQERAMTRLRGVLRATGNAAGFSADELASFAAQLQKTTTFGDETTIAATSVLATFDKIRGPVFKDAIRVGQDMSIAFGQDLKGSMIQLGKALQDPVSGITALRRVGAVFTDEVNEQIKSLVKQNKLMSAQALIIAELKKQFGGLAAEMAKTRTGQVEKLGNDWSDVKEQAGGALLAVTDNVIGLKNLATVLRGMPDYLSGNAGRLDAITAEGATVGAPVGETKLSKVRKIIVDLKMDMEKLQHTNADLFVEQIGPMTNLLVLLEKEERKLREITKRHKERKDEAAAAIAISSLVAKSPSGLSGLLGKIGGGASSVIGQIAKAGSKLDAIGGILPAGPTLASLAGRQNSVKERLAGLNEQGRSSPTGGSRVGVGGMGALLQGQLETGKREQKQRDDDRNTLLKESKEIQKQIRDKASQAIFG